VGIAELVEVEDVQDGKATGGRGEGAACARQRQARGHQEQDDKRKRRSGVALLCLRSLSRSCCCWCSACEKKEEWRRMGRKHLGFDGTAVVVLKEAEEV
jgi:hypothetical protein